jgi:hypothetical protein
MNKLAMHSLVCAVGIRHAAGCEIKPRRTALQIGGDPRGASDIARPVLVHHLPHYHRSGVFEPMNVCSRLSRIRGTGASESASPG